MQLERITEQLKMDEGYRKFPYKCTADKLTIGYGRNLEDVGISINGASYLLSYDLKMIFFRVSHCFNWFLNLSDVRQEVVINMIYQLGSSGFFKFKNTIKLIEEGNYLFASDEMLNSKWAKQTPKRAKRLSYAMKHNKFMKGGN